MSMSFGCRCAERRKPVVDRAWKVTQRQCNHSAFNGYQYTPSDYSTVMCLVCGAIGRTKARFVGALKDASNEDLGIKP